MEDTKGFVAPLLLLLIIAFLVLGGGSYWYANKTQNAETSTRTYQGPGFTLEIPSDWRIEKGEGCGSRCVNFIPPTVVVDMRQPAGFVSESHVTNPGLNQETLIKDFLLEFPFAKLITVNGYPTVFVESEVYSPAVDQTSSQYIIVHGNTRVTISFISKNTRKPSPEPNLRDYSQYLSDYESIVNSIKFD